MANTKGMNDGRFDFSVLNAAAAAKEKEKTREEVFREMFGLPDQAEARRKKEATPTQISDAERRAIVLYGIADRDFVDFLDMLQEKETSPQSIEILRKICEHSLATGARNTDLELNRMILDTLKGRDAESRTTAYDHIMNEED